MGGAMWVLVCGVVVALAAGRTAAANESWLTHGAHLDSVAGVDLTALEPSPQRVAELKAADAGYVDLLVRNVMHLDGDGSSRAEFTLVRRYLTKQGVEDAGDIEFPVSPEFDTVSIEQAVVINPDGVHAADPLSFQIRPRGEPRLFTDLRDVIVPLPGLQPGSTAIFRVRERRMVPDFLRPWSSVMLLRGRVPLERLEEIVSWDAGVATPSWAATASAAHCAADGERRLRCVSTECPPFQIDPDLGAFFDTVPQLVLSEASTWEPMVEHLTAIVEQQVASGDVRELAAQVTAGAATPRARLDALFRFVADQIRYVGMEQGKGAVVPRPPQVTLHNRFGDCKDKSVLLVAMARAVGLQAHATLVGTYYHQLGSLLLPSGSYFNHMIVCVRGVAAEELCVDPTVPHVPAEQLAVSVQGAVALDLVTGTAAPRTLPSPRYAAEVTVDGVMNAACEGTLTETVTRTFSGQAALNLRGALAGLSTEERQRWLEEEFRRALNHDVSARMTLRDLDAPTARIVVESRTTYSGRPLREVDGYADFDLWLMFYGFGARSTNRNFPYRNSGLRYESTFRIDFCSEVTPAFLGARLDFRAPLGSLQRRYERDGQQVRVQTTLELPAADIAVDQIPSFNRFLERSLDQAGIWVGWAKTH